jgi:hypothetical protein
VVTNGSTRASSEPNVLDALYVKYRRRNRVCRNGDSRLAWSLRKEVVLQIAVGYAAARDGGGRWVWRPEEWAGAVREKCARIREPHEEVG